MTSGGLRQILRVVVAIVWILWDDLQEYPAFKSSMRWVEYDFVRRAFLVNISTARVDDYYGVPNLSTKRKKTS